MSFFHSISPAVFSQAIIYIFTYAGLAFTPGAFKSLKWLFPLWFLIINLLLFSGVWQYSLGGVRLYFILISLVPAIFITAYLVTAAQHGLIQIDLRQWAGWSAYRLMGACLFFMVPGSAIPREFLLSAALFETGTGIGAVFMYFIIRFKPRTGWYLFIFWNTIGLLSAWKINGVLQGILFSGPADLEQKEILRFFSAFPEIWLAGFWIPLSLCIHITLFYGLWSNRKLLRW